VTWVGRITAAVGPNPIFISYRRDDTSGYAGRLQDDLGELFGDEQVFRDVLRIEPGKDYVDVIDDALGSCSAMLVVIGREWLDLREETGRRRLDNPEDVLRLEVSAALARDTLVIPVLVEKAQMPTAEELPEPLRALARRQAIELSDVNWDYDVARLAEAITAATGTAALAPHAAAVRGIPAPVLVAVAGVVALLAVVLGLRMVMRDDRPTPMTGRLNIAVADFAQLDAGGDIVKSAGSTQLSRTFDRLVDQEVRSVDGGQEVQHRRIGRLDEPDPDRRTAAAARIGAQLAADVVVYGVLQTDTTGSVLTPEFFITDRLLFDASELVGAHQLGTPIRAAGGDISRLAVQSQLLDLLKARVQVLAEVTVALRNYSVGTYASALDHLTAAERLPGWAPEDGKEVLYLLLGNMSGRLGRLPDAEAWYDRALTLRPDYSRATIGKAEALYRGAIRSCEPGDVDATGLRRSLALYGAARAGRQPAGAEVPAKVDFGEGRVLLCLSQAQEEDSFGEAGARFERVVSAYGKGKEGLRELAAEAHANLGTVYAPTGPDEPGAREMYQRAAGALRKAIGLYAEVGVHRDRQALFYANLGWVEARLGHAKASEDAFRVAIALAPDDKTKDEYRQDQRNATRGIPS